MRGDELTPWLIRYAYEQGAFPMTVDEEDNEVEWFQPRVRAIFPIEGIHLSRSMKRVIGSIEGGSKHDPRFTITFDQAFSDVMRSCMRPGENWISEDFIRVYSEIHEQGWGHSCEVWSVGARDSDRAPEATSGRLAAGAETGDPGGHLWAGSTASPLAPVSAPSQCSIVPRTRPRWPFGPW